MEKKLDDFLDRKPCFLREVQKLDFVICNSEKYGLAIAWNMGTPKDDPLAINLLIISGPLTQEDLDAHKVEICYVGELRVTPQRELPDVYLIGEEEIKLFPGDRFKDRLLGKY